MNPQEKRRAFLRTTLGLGAVSATATMAEGIEPIQRTGRPAMRLSLAAYSFRQALNLNKPTMTLDQYIDLAATYPLDAVELTAYYFRETTPRALAQLKGRCTRLGLDISGTAVGNNFCRTNDSRLKEEIANVRSWIEHTSRLGGKTIRIFAGNVERGDTLEAARRRAIAAIEEVCSYAGEFGIYLALENHGGITSTSDELLEIVRAVKSPWFGVNLDSGNFRTPDPYADLARIAPYAVVAQLKTEITRMGQKAEEADLRRLVAMLRQVNYRGYVVLEYEASEDVRVAAPRYLRQLRELCAG